MHTHSIEPTYLLNLTEPLVDFLYSDQWALMKYFKLSNYFGHACRLILPPLTTAQLLPLLNTVVKCFLYQGL